jgi:hypothetical protein
MLRLLLPLMTLACFPRGEAANLVAAPVEVAEEGPTRFADQRPVDRVADPRRADADGHQTVTVGALYLDQHVVVPAPAVTSAVLAEIEHNAGHLQRCYDARAADVPGLNGTISIHAHITPEGAVDGQCIGEDTIGDEVLVACVNEVIAMGRYAHGQSATVDVTVPFVFTPRASRG